MIDDKRLAEMEAFSHEIGTVQGGMLRDLIAEVRRLQSRLDWLAECEKLMREIADERRIP